MEVKRKEGEATSSLMYRFTKRVQQSGVLRETKKRRFYDRPQSKIKRRASALYRSKREVEIKRLKKLGKI